MTQMQTDGVTGAPCPTRRSPVTDRGSRSSAALVALIAAVAIVAYLNALSGAFTFDDVGVIRDNPAVQIRPAVELLGYVYQPGALYRPLTMLTYAANASVSRAPFGYHLLNILLHALVSVAVFFLALRVLGSRLGATAAAVLFAVHPIHTEAVTGVVGRAELLSALAVLVTLLTFLRARDSASGRRIVWMAASVAAFGAGLLAKESAFTALGLLAVLHWWIDRRASLYQRCAALVPYAAVGAAYLVLRLAAVGALGMPEAAGALDNPLAHVDLWARLRTTVIVLWDYIGLLALPLHLSSDYSFDQIPVAQSWLDPRFLVATVLLAGVTGAILAAARRAPVLIVAALFTVVPLALTANLLFPIGTIKAERLLYLPSVGWVLASGWLTARAAAQRSPRWLVAVALLAAAYGARTWMRNRDWRDDPTLYAATLVDAPDSAKAHYNAAVMLEVSDRLDDAMVHYRRALEIYPEYGAAALGIGSVYAKRGIDVGALHWFEEALRRDPYSRKVHLQIGLLYELRGEHDAAEAAFRTGLASAPNDPLLLVNLSAVRLNEGDWWGAAETLAELNHVDTLDREEHTQVALMRHAIEVSLR